MNKNRLMNMIAAVSAVAVSLGITVAAAYDSSEDPLISFSYLNVTFRGEILNEVDNKIYDLEDRLSDLINTNTGTTPSAPEPTSSSVYEVIELKSGDALYAVSACDIMLRSGTAVCIAPDANQGIADYTNATEILNGQPFEKNHMCLIPRGDGRGLRATSESVFIMVRGDYTIVKN